jgi:hypothetical protein
VERIFKKLHMHSRDELLRQSVPQVKSEKMIPCPAHPQEVEARPRVVARVIRSKIGMKIRIRTPDTPLIRILYFLL